MRVEVVYARADAQDLIALEVDAGMTAAEAVSASGLPERFPEIEPREARRQRAKDRRSR